MKVWEKINELKGSSETRDKILGWAYMHRVTPCIFEEGLELDVPYPKEFDMIMDRVCSEVMSSDRTCEDCLLEFLDTECSG